MEKKSRMLVTSKLNGTSGNEGTDISTLLTVFPTNCKFTLEIAYKFIKIFKEFAETGKVFLKKEFCIKVSKATGIGIYSCATHLTELRKAAKAGYTLEKYFELNRPFKPLAAYKKVLA